MTRDGPLWLVILAVGTGAFIRAGVHMASHLLLSLTGTWAGWTAVRSL